MQRTIKLAEAGICLSYDVHLCCVTHQIPLLWPLLSFLWRIGATLGSRELNGPATRATYRNRGDAWQSFVGTFFSGVVENVFSLQHHSAEPLMLLLLLLLLLRTGSPVCTPLLTFKCNSAEQQWHLITWVPYQSDGATIDTHVDKAVVGFLSEQRICYSAPWTPLASS